MCKSTVSHTTGDLVIDTINDILKHHVVNIPQNIALRDIETGKEITYKELYEISCRLSWGLTSNGITKKDVVGLTFDNTVEMIISQISCSLLGVPFITLSYNLGTEEYKSQVQRSNPRLILDKNNFNDFVKVDPPDINFCNGAADDYHMISVSSGSTGKAKHHRPTQAMRISRFKIFSQNVKLTSNDTIYIAWSFSHNPGTSWIGTALFAGATMLVDNSAVLFDKVMNTERPTHVCSSPYTLVEGLDEKIDWSCLSCYFVGGSPMRISVIEKIESLMNGGKFIKGYVMGESSMPCTGTLDDDLETRLATVGKPTFPDKIKIVDDSIYLHESLIAYPTNKECVDGWYDTGDLGSFTDDGYLVLSGRKKSLIRYGGSSRDVNPFELEELIERNDNIKKAVVVPVWRHFAQFPCVILMPEDINIDIDIDLIRKDILDKMQMTIDSIHLWSEETNFPLKGHKIDRKKLSIKYNKIERNARDREKI